MKIAKRLLIWVVVLFVLPLLPFFCAEGVLRLVGYGESTQPFVKKTSEGVSFYARNLAFIQLFFPWSLPLREWEAVEWTIPVEKNPETYRIFVFGGSAPEGWPNPEYSFSRMLQGMLNEIETEKKVEVYNLAFRALNSHVMREQAAFCAKHLDPDLFVIYMGNNEFHGPFGPLPPHPEFYPEDLPPEPIFPSWRIRSWIKLNDLRLIQALRFVLYEKLGRMDAKNRWYKTGAVQANDPRSPMVLAHYEENLKAMIQAGESVGAQVILNTVPVNWRDWRPIHAKHLTPISDEEKRQWDDYYAQGREAAQAGEYRQALDYYQQAAAIESTKADLSFDRGVALWALGEKEAARPLFREAMEHDSFYWVRAKQRINDTLGKVAQSVSSPGLSFVDLEAVFRDASPHGCPGKELFLDYCHLSYAGSYLVATQVLKAMQAMPDTSLFSPTGEIQAPLDQEATIAGMGLHPFSYYPWWSSVADSQEPYADSCRAAMREAGEAWTQLDPPLYAQERMRREKVFAAGRADSFCRLAHLKAKKNYLHPFLEEAQAMLLEYPFLRIALRYKAEALVKEGMIEDAHDQYRNLLVLYPDDAPSRCVLARSSLETGALEDALRYLEAGGTVLFKQPEVNFLYGQIKQEQGAWAEAQAAYSREVEYNKEHSGAWAALESAVWAHDSKSMAYWQDYELRVRYTNNPYPKACIAMQYLRQGDTDQARSLFQEAAKENGNSFIMQELLTFFAQVFLTQAEFSRAFFLFDILHENGSESFDYEEAYRKAVPVYVQAMLAAGEEGKAQAILEEAKLRMPGEKFEMNPE